MSILDAITTYHALKVKGTREANPIMAWFFSKLGIVPAIVITKALVIYIVWSTMGIYSTWALAGISTIYAFVIWNNYKIIRKGRS